MSQPLRVGVVGAGAFGQNHARVYSTLEGVKLTGVADVNFDRAREIAALYHAEAFDNPAALLGRVDAVSVAVPTVKHLEAAEPFLRAGVHALVEKPIAPSVEDAQKLIDAARAGGAVLAVGHLERFNPAVEYVLDTVRHPVFVEVHRLSGFPDRSLDVDVLLDLMVHDLDILLALTGSPVTGLHAVGVPVLTPRVDIASVRLDFASGCVANLTASRISAETLRKFRVFEPHRYVGVDYRQQSVDEFRLASAPGEARPRILPCRPEVRHEEPLHRELAHFAGCARSGKRPRVNGEAGLAALDLALRVRAEIDRRLGSFPKA